MRLLLTLVALASFATPAFAQNGTVMPVPKVQFFDNSGNPCSGCLLNAYVAGTSMRLDTYSDVALTTPNANPVQLDAAGRATVYLSANSYRFTLTNSTGGTTYWDQDNVSATHVGVSGVANAGDLVFQVDTDNNGSNIFSWVDGLGTERAQLTEAGDFQIDGSLTVGDGTEADKGIIFDGNTQDFYLCGDDSADDLVIGRGSTCGTAPAVSINGSNGAVTVDGGSFGVVATPVLVLDGLYFEARQSGVAYGYFGDAGHLISGGNTGDFAIRAENELQLNIGGSSAYLHYTGSSGLFGPSASGGADLGSTGAPWAKLFLSDTLVTGGDIVGSGNVMVRRGTTDGADDGFMTFAGGGGQSADRGAHIVAFGNEHANTGQLRYRVGNVSGAGHQFYRADGTQAFHIAGDTGAVAVTGSATVGSNFGVGGVITAGSGNVTLTDTTGNLQAGVLTGTITSAVQDNITRLGTVTSGTFSGTLGAISGTSLTSLDASNLSTGSVPIARMPTSGTWTLSGLLQLSGAAAGIEAMTMPGVSNVTVGEATNNWNPTGLNTATVFRVDTSSNSYNITGITAPSDDWRVVVIVPVSSSGGLTLVHASGDSNEQNRILLPNNTNVALSAGETAILWYDSTSSRWRMFGGVTP